MRAASGKPSIGVIYACFCRCLTPSVEGRRDDGGSGYCTGLLRQTTVRPHRPIGSKRARKVLS